MIYTQDSTGPAYRIHALDLGSLTDKVTPQLVVASHTLTDGTTFNFNATYQRQRPGLLLANGNVYAGFGSFCDFAANLSRGWLLGWSTGSLTPLPANQVLRHPGHFARQLLPLLDLDVRLRPRHRRLRQHPLRHRKLRLLRHHLRRRQQHSGKRRESVVRTCPPCSTCSLPRIRPVLDQSDADFGSGGVLVLPDQPGSTPHLAVAAGKDGSLFLMNEDNLGGYSTTKNNVLGTYSVGGCWCGQSYFVDPADGVGRVVTSGGQSDSGLQSPDLAQSAR